MNISEFNKLFDKVAIDQTQRIIDRLHEPSILLNKLINQKEGKSMKSIFKDMEKNRIERAKIYLRNEQIDQVRHEINFLRASHDTYKSNRLIKEYLKEEYGVEIDFRLGRKGYKKILEDNEKYIPRIEYDYLTIRQAINHRARKAYDLIHKRKDRLKEKYRNRVSQLNARIGHVKIFSDRLFKTFEQEKLPLPYQVEDEINIYIQKLIDKTKPEIETNKKMIETIDLDYCLGFFDFVRSEKHKIPLKEQTRCKVCCRYTNTDYRSFCNKCFLTNRKKE